MTIEVSGLDALIRDVTFAANRVRPEAAKMIVKQGDAVAQKMRDTVPVDEGNVLDSITSDDSATEDGTGVWVEAGPDMEANRQAFVARFLEDGTSKMAPRSFVEPSLARQVPELVKALGDVHDGLWR